MATGRAACKLAVAAVTAAVKGTNALSGVPVGGFFNAVTASATTAVLAVMAASKSLNALISFSISSRSCLVTSGSR